MDINLFNPVGVGVAYAVIVAFVLGMLHGVTPDEHTWPITFSYAIGSFSTKKGAKTASIFSLGFTLQRAVMSEVFFIVFNNSLFGLKTFLQSGTFFASIYFVVGFVMGIAGYYIKYGHGHPHLELNSFLKGRKGRLDHKPTDFYKRGVSNSMALLHGLIAGFGMGAFALIIFTILAPQMPNVYLGFLPGAVFGLGTMVMQVIFGAAFGASLRRIKKLTEKGLQFLARYMSSAVLLYGGITFMVAGIVSLILPQVLYLGIPTGLSIYNLDSINMGFILVIITVVVIGTLSYLKGVSIVKNGKLFSGGARV